MLLDHQQNDIYVHVDKKSEGFDIQQFANLTKKSNLVFIDRRKVAWGGYSLLGCELALLKQASEKHYDYYHLNAGDCLPIKSQDQFLAFFEENKGQEFLSYQDGVLSRKSFVDRVQYYHFFQELIGRPKKNDPLVYLNKASLKLQEAIGVNRIRHTKQGIKKGLTWCSITHGLANYFVNLEPKIRKTYRFTFVPEEICFQTLAWASPFRDKICNNSLRLLDWKRGGPYTFRNEDFEQLVNSDCFWARKFNETVDQSIIDRIIAHIQH